MDLWPRDKPEIFSEAQYMENVNSIIKALLDAGADPNKRGHYRLLEDFTKQYLLTDKKVRTLCSSPDATSPLYEAIKKGMKWEDQVDLLLEYGAVLDESCLKAAEESGDEAMIEKVSSLYNATKEELVQLPGGISALNPP